MNHSDVIHLEDKGFVFLGETNDYTPIYINGSQLLICTDLMAETFELFDINNKKIITNIKDI